jgi:hypothetical protein
MSEWLRTGALHEWVTQGARLLGNERDPSLLSTFLVATPAILPVLSQKEIAEWGRVGLDMASADARIFRELPDGFVDLTDTERPGFYRLIRSAAYRSPRIAAALYWSLPRSLCVLSHVSRNVLLRALQAAATFDPEPLPTALPFFVPTIRSLTPETQSSLLDRIAQLAQTFPAGIARLFRSLSRAYDEVGEEGVKAWIAAGETIAQKNPQAGEAFFALESRTSLLLLHGASPAVHLHDIQGVLLKYIHMLCGDAMGIAEAPYLSLLPSLAEESGEAVPLPACVEVFPTYEENFRLYRVLAAQQAGRMAFGSYDYSMPRFWSSLPALIHQSLQSLGREATPPDDIASYFQLFPQPEQMEALFLFVESQRVAKHVARVYRGLRVDLAWASSLTHLLPPVLNTVFPRLPQALWRELGKDATVHDSLLLATELHVWLLGPNLKRNGAGRSTTQTEESEPVESEAAAMSPLDESGAEPTSPLSPEQQELLRKIFKAIRSHGTKKRTPRKPGMTTTITLDVDMEEGEEDNDRQQKKKRTDRRVQTATGLSYLYDEWDFLIEDYRTHWCQVQELPVIGDEGAFFSRTLTTYANLTEEIKREFQRLRPRLYRQVKGLEDGEHIDLDAAISARVDSRSGIAPSPKLYIARQPLERDVAALFLLDLSASTDTQLAEREGVRVIDVMKESVVLLSAALDTIGDVYAIYGFSSQGRRNIELYPVKSFVEPLSAEVKGRIGGLTPQKSTRMGAAVRHATRKLRDLSCRAKFLVLLSDGHPEDADYGPSGQTPTYGLRDTTMALREAEQNGILSFCLTVDKAGRDYLREMCAPSRYMVIDDPTSLPTELPKIYQRHIRLQKE